MPIPSKNKDENPKDFMSRCMGDSVMNKEYPDQSQRTAVCMSKACEDLGHVEAVDFQLTYGKFKYKDPVTNEIYQFDRKGVYRKNNRVLIPLDDD